MSQQQEPFVGAVDTRYWPLEAIGKDLACLDNAVRSFDKLESITVDLEPERSSVSKVLQDLNRLDYRDAPHRSLGHTFLKTVLRTLGEAGRSISRLRAWPIMLTNAEILCDPEDKARRAIGSTIAQLTCFQVKIESRRKGIHGVEIWQREWLVSILAAPTNLRELELDLPCDWTWYPDILKPLWSLHRPVLESLVLRNVYLAEGSFLDFLLHRGPKLKRISLERTTFLPERGHEGLHW